MLLEKPDLHIIKGGFFSNIRLIIGVAGNQRFSFGADGAFTFKQQA